jgi:hypothetical protein
VLYRTWNIVERFFNRIEHFRRVATRYDKLVGNYLAFASLACAFGAQVSCEQNLVDDSRHPLKEPFESWRTRFDAWHAARVVE